MKNVPDLKSQLFARRRWHEIGNPPNDTLEQRRKRDRIVLVAVWVGAIVFTPIFFALLVYLPISLAPGEVLPLGFGLMIGLMICFVEILSLYSCCHLIVTFLNPKPGLGRWIIFNDGIFYRYGKSPHRFVSFSSFCNVRVEQPNHFGVIVFDTTNEPLRISIRTREGHCRSDTHVLPFLNFLIDRLQQNGWKETDLASLCELRRICQSRIVEEQYFLYMVWLMMACFFAPLLCVLLFYRYIVLLSYPVILWAIPVCILVVLSMGFALKSRLERWKNKKIAEKLHSLCSSEPVA